MNRIVKIFSIAAALLVISTGAQAVVISVTDAEYLGLINDGIPSNPANEAIYINNLTTLAAGAGNTVIGTETYNRLGSTLAGPFPAVTDTDAFKNEDGIATVTLTGTFQYVLGKYDASQAGSLVWFFADGITGEITLPGSLNGLGISHISAYNMTDCCTRTVPEPGTLSLLGGVLLGVGILRRRRKIWG